MASAVLNEKNNQKNWIEISDYSANSHDKNTHFRKEQVTLGEGLIRALWRSPAAIHWILSFIQSILWPSINKWFEKCICDLMVWLFIGQIKETKPCFIYIWKKYHNIQLSMYNSRNVN